MDNFETLQIHFRSDGDVYTAGSVAYAGGTVQGRVFARVRAPQMVQSVTLHITGSARTRWMETEQFEVPCKAGHHCHNGCSHHSAGSCHDVKRHYAWQCRSSSANHCHTNNHHHSRFNCSNCCHPNCSSSCHRNCKEKRSRQVTYSSEQGLLDIVKVVWQDSSSALLPGQDYNFPFEFTLPIGCPPSMEGACGSSIRFLCTVRANLPGTVAKVVDSAIIVRNLLSADNRPVVDEQCMESGCFKVKLLNTKVSIPRSAFAPTEKLPVTFELVPPTKHTFRRVKLKLVECATFRGTRQPTNDPHDPRRNGGGTHTTGSETTLVKLKEEIGKEENTSNLLMKMLPVPANAVSVSNCNLISISYYVKVKFLTQKGLFGGHVLRCRFPVTVGAIAATPLLKEMKSPVCEPLHTGNNYAQQLHPGNNYAQQPSEDVQGQDQNELCPAPQIGWMPMPQ